MNQPIITRPLGNDLLQVPTYDPANLLDTIMKKYGLKTDSALSGKLEVTAPVISKVRRRHIPVSDSLLIRMHDITKMSIGELRQLMGVSN